MNTERSYARTNCSTNELPCSKSTQIDREIQLKHNTVQKQLFQKQEIGYLSTTVNNNLNNSQRSDNQKKFQEQTQVVN